jgi:hypothetical protein
MDCFFLPVEAINCQVVIPEWTVDHVNFLSFDAGIDFSRGLVSYRTYGSCIEFYKSRELSILDFVKLNLMIFIYEDKTVLLRSKGHSNRADSNGTYLFRILSRVYFDRVAAILLNGKIFSNRGRTHPFNSTRYKRSIEVYLLPINFPEIACGVNDQEILVVLGE